MAEPSVAYIIRWNGLEHRIFISSGVRARNESGTSTGIPCRLHTVRSALDFM